jgi:4-aminobutyrate aminotransferase/(S)-3-amino-2-methylpropionate transaminase
MHIKLTTEIPGPRSRALMADRHAHVARGPFHSTPIFAERAHGALVEDVDGNTLIDFASGIAVVNMGHTPEAVVKAIQEQAEKIIHSSFNVIPTEAYVRLAERLNALAPGDFAKKTFLVNSGAEAVENAIKIARVFTGRQAVVCFDHAFHGRTYMAMSLTSKAKPYKSGFSPLCPEVYRAPFPYAYRCPEPDAAAYAMRHLRELILHQIGAENVAAVILEPVLGEGGYVEAPPAFMSALRELCTAHGIVLILDEIQTGFGRTGTMFACEQLGVVPDLMTLAKGLGGGMPIGAVTGRADIMDAPEGGGIGGTYGGNPVACASALAVLAMIEADSRAILARSRALGERLRGRLEAWKARYAAIGDVRGMGPMLGIEIVKDRATKEPDKEATQKVALHCYERGVVVLTAGTYGNVIRLAMPLVIEDSVLDEGLAVMESGFAALGARA